MADTRTILGGGIEIDLGALTRNYQALDRISGQSLTAAVVKADAYGTGLTASARTLYHAGARFFFVATPDEGVSLRRAVPDAHIFVLDGLLPRTARDYAAHRLMPVLSSLAQLGEWLEFCLAQSQAHPAALHFDTGMNRLGIRMQEVEAVREMLDRSGFAPQMIMTHLACADTPRHEKNGMQVAFFQQIMRSFPDIPASIANSAGLMTSRELHLQMVRPGIALYGGRAVSGRPNPMAQVVSMQVPILQVRSARMDETVGYGATYTLGRDSRLAVLALGYADGFLRSLSSGGSQRRGGQVAIRGQIAPVLGRVSMDLVAVDVTDIDGRVEAGDLVEVLGQTVTADDQADAAGTISYEILTTLNGRFPRRYVNVPDGVEID